MEGKQGEFLQPPPHLLFASLRTKPPFFLILVGKQSFELLVSVKSWENGEEFLNPMVKVDSVF